jgi:uncharacterized protein YbjT (DUF2867 family)
MAMKTEFANAKTATIIGATGLIGSHLLALLQNDPSFKTTRVLSRRAVSFDHPKVQTLVIDFADKAAFKSAIAGSDAVFCAIGTTQKKVKGDKIAYRKVDYDIPVNAAQFCAETGCLHFLLVSSVGANSQSNNFYLKLKGEVEDRLRTMNIGTISIFRPSMLLGKREERRFGEGIAQGLMRSLSLLIPSQYRPIEAGEVARAMVAASRKETPGIHIYHYAEMMPL